MTNFFKYLFERTKNISFHFILFTTISIQFIKDAHLEKVLHVTSSREQAQATQKDDIIANIIESKIQLDQHR